MYSCGMTVGDVEKMLPLVLGASSVTVPAFLCTVGEDSMSVSELPGLRFNKGEAQGEGGRGSEGDQHLLRVPTLTQVQCVARQLYFRISVCPLVLSVPQMSQYPFKIILLSLSGPRHY